MSKDNLNKNYGGEEANKSPRPFSRNNYLPTTQAPDEEYWEDEYGDLDNFEKMPKAKKNSEWR